MAKASVEVICPTCGRAHYWSTTKYNRKEANDWEAWAEGQERECPECYAETCRKEREAKAQAEIAQAKENEFGIDIDALELGGSEKQNAWAKTLLAEFVNAKVNNKLTWEVVYNTIHKRGIAFRWEDFGVLTKNDAAKIIADILKNLQAREIIDNRSSIRYLIAEKILDKYNSK